MGREKGNYNGKGCFSGGLRWGEREGLAAFLKSVFSGDAACLRAWFQIFLRMGRVCYLKKRPQQALNFLCEPQMQSCFMPGKGVVGSMKYQRLLILTKADNS